MLCTGWDRDRRLVDATLESIVAIAFLLGTLTATSRADNDRGAIESDTII